MSLTLSIIKPDAVKRKISGEINALIEKNDIKIVAQKMIHLSIDIKYNVNSIIVNKFLHCERFYFCWQ